MILFLLSHPPSDVECEVVEGRHEGPGYHQVDGELHQQGRCGGQHIVLTLQCTVLSRSFLRCLPIIVMRIENLLRTMSMGRLRLLVPPSPHTMLPRWNTGSGQILWKVSVDSSGN